MKKTLKKLILLGSLLSCSTVFFACNGKDNVANNDNNIIESTDDTVITDEDDNTIDDNQVSDNLVDGANTSDTEDNQTVDDNTSNTEDNQTVDDNTSNTEDNQSGDENQTGDNNSEEGNNNDNTNENQNEEGNTSNEGNEDENENTSTDDNQDENGDTSDENQIEQFTINFEANNCKVYIYDTQDMSGEGTEALEAIAKDASGNIVVDGTGQINFIIVPDDGFVVDITCITISGTYNKLKSLLEDGYENGYRITKVNSDLNVVITAILAEEASDNVTSFIITSYNENVEYTLYGQASVGTFTYTYENGLLTINTEALLTLSLSGDYYGSIVINSTADVELGLNGCNITSSETCPLYVNSEGNADISAKSGTVNYIRDYRATVADDSTTDVSATIYSVGDLKLKGKGELYVYSTYNNGIHTKDDLVCQNLDLTVNVCDNALKGNDSVTISSGTYTLIATAGDGIKTSNSAINSNNIQKGTITIDGGTINIYSAFDGIDAAYDVIINNDPVINIYTDKYSTYSTETSYVTDSVYYIRSTSQSYKYSIYYYNSSTGEYVWKNASTTPKYTVSGQMGRTTYYYYECEKPSGYDKLIVYVYNSTQSQGQSTSYYKASSYLSINDDKDTIAWSNNSFSFTNYTTQSSQPGGGMQDGNSDKASYSSKGIKSFNSIIINGGTIYIKAYDDAIHANNDEALESGVTPLGNVEINGGILTVYSNDDGIHADGILTINDGTIKVEYSYEGIEGTKIIVNGGSTTVISKDDGFNSTLSTGTYGITITGGEIYVYAGGDGIDANTTTQYGGFLITGGKTVVISTSGGNSCLDTEQGYTYQGGYVVAMCPTGMTSECEKVSGGISSYGKTANTTLTANYYLTISNMVVIKLPSSISNGYVIELGNKSATVSTSSTSTYTFNDNGVVWLV